MAEQEKKLSLTEEIYLDEGLKSKRKLLTITSLILLALSFSGAKVEEANTFILKLTFTNQDGIGIFLALAIFFLLIRYFNYAQPYHQKIFRGWSDRMLRNQYFYSGNPYDPDDVKGLIIERRPGEMGFTAIEHEGQSLNFTYKCSPPFCRKFTYIWSETANSGYHSDTVHIGWKNYPKVIWFELKYQFSSYFTHREILDVFSAYFLGTAAIASYFFNDSFQALIKLLAVS